ncbi:MAG: diacylglycerol kinase [Thermus sp.]|uniref:diacylglycerol kinase n=1 Tax=unclassified Thermus TaxID=2619321 RepID=UPI0012DF484D|nr:MULTISPECIES: diacylglycerol kinase [unclassified Thermus]MCS6868053.1 diacylglycerol kinase [Thermus sp.]MCS7217584.1 diacylglycerol kinase [Thermus sp.]MCX7849424.1 diacylglycerol kinase [Thermus sp.]MDW8017664.1 diacylglycerol kinase [Thermus sp.]MDW8356921.1 diacylglycerol kinase [Thermus sp.]
MGRVPPRPREDPHPLKGVVRSFGYAWEGVVYAWRVQRNFRLEVYLGLLALGLSLWLGVSPVPVLLLIALVLSLELLNTALEALTDLASPVYHPLAKRAKDTAAAAVLLASLLALLVGLYLFLPPLLGRLGLS